MSFATKRTTEKSFTDRQSRYVGANGSKLGILDLPTEIREQVLKEVKKNLIGKNILNQVTKDFDVQSGNYDVVVNMCTFEVIGDPYIMNARHGELMSMKETYQEVKPFIYKPHHQAWTYRMNSLDPNPIRPRADYIDIFHERLIIDHRSVILKQTIDHFLDCTTMLNAVGGEFDDPVHYKILHVDRASKPQGVDSLRPVYVCGVGKDSEHNFLGGEEYTVQDHQATIFGDWLQHQKIFDFMPNEPSFKFIDNS